IHVPAFALAAGVQIDWDDFAELSEAVPLLARVYPNGAADVNQFHAAGGIGLGVKELLRAGLMQRDIVTARAGGMAAYTREPWLDNDALAYREIEGTAD